MLKAYGYDIDSNLVFTDNTIWLDKWQDGTWVPTEVSQTQHDDMSAEGILKEKKIYRYLNDDVEASMINFRGADRFEKDIFDAINKPNNTGKWPSWGKFIEGNRYASPIAEITARWYPVEDLRSTHKKIILDVLTSSQQEDFLSSMQERLWDYEHDEAFYIEKYLNNNYYAPCSNEEFLASIWMTLKDTMSDRKNAAFEQFVLLSKRVFTGYYGTELLKNRKIRIGFSDDVEKNIRGIHEFIDNKENGIRWKYPEILFRVYDTWDNLSPAMKISYTNPVEK